MAGKFIERISSTDMCISTSVIALKTCLLLEKHERMSVQPGEIEALEAPYFDPH